MEYRFDQAQLIAEKLTDAALHAVAGRVNPPKLEEDQFAVVLFNASQSAIDGPVDLSLWFPHDTDKIYQEFFGFERKAGFRLYDTEGREIPYDYINHNHKKSHPTRPKRKIPFLDEFFVVNVCAPLKIPAFGYTTLICKPLAEHTRHPAGRLVISDRALANEHLAVEVNDNGSLRLHDKRTDQTYDRLLVIEERADIGDGWFHGLAVNDEIHSSTASPAEVALVENGAFKSTLRIRNRMQIPNHFCFDTMRRSDQRTTLQINHYVTLRAGADHLEIRTVLDNNARDHRIRVLFESGADANVYHADSAFDVIERPIALPPDSHTYKEIVVETTPQSNWTAVHDAKRGLAIVAPGLPETTVRDIPDRPIALTLLRGFMKTVFTDGETRGQSLGHHEFRYRLVPLAGTLPSVRLAELGQQTAAGIRSVRLTANDLLAANDRTLPPTRSLLTLDPGQTVVTSLRQRQDNGCLELRCYNPSDQPVDERLAFDQRPASATMTDLAGEEIESLSVDDNGLVRVGLGPRQIATIAVRFAQSPSSE